LGVFSHAKNIKEVEIMPVLRIRIASLRLIVYALKKFKHFPHLLKDKLATYVVNQTRVIGRILYPKKI